MKANHQEKKKILKPKIQPRRVVQEDVQEIVVKLGSIL